MVGGRVIEMCHSLIAQFQSVNQTNIKNPGHIWVSGSMLMGQQVNTFDLVSTLITIHQNLLIL